MKIAFDLSQDKWLGGTEVATYRIARELAERGHDVYIITRYSKGLPRRQTKDGFTIIRTPRWRIPILGTLVYCFLACFKLRHIKPDIIHEQGFGILGLFCKMFTRTPYIVWGRGLRFAEGFTYWEKLMAKIILSKASAIIAQTKYMKNQIEEICSKNITVLPNGVDVTRFMRISPQAVRQELSIGEKCKIILFVGNLLPIKGVEYLIEAMTKVVQNYPESRLVVAGVDFQSGKLQELAQEKNLQGKVVFAGFIPPDRIPEYMVAADVFVLPSLSEGFPNVLLEAMAAGLPIVATRVGGLPEIVTEGENGFLVEPRNSQQLAEKIMLLLQDEEIRKGFSTNNIKKAEQYSWSKIVTSLEEVYLKAKKR